MGLWRRRNENFVDRVFLVATTEAELPLGEHVLTEELDIGVVGTLTTDGRPALPIFTSEKRLVAWGPQGSPWIGLKGRDILALFLNGEWEAVVIDPTERDGRELPRDEARQLLSQSV